MKLVGGLQLGPIAPGDYSFYGNLFSRLPKEVRNTGELTRELLFDYSTDSGDPIKFLGIEVDGIENIPDGMIAWDFDANELTILESKEGRNSITWEQKIEWLWSDISHSEGKPRLTGDFKVKVPPEWCGPGVSEERLFQITGNCYITPKQMDFDDSIELVEYDPTWPEKFNEMAAWLRESLGENLITDIQHFGSTSVPGLIAKPLIDVMVQVSSFEKVKPIAFALFNNKGWEYWGSKDHLQFVKRNGFKGKRTHHIHFWEAGSEVLNKLAFRDYLRTHPEDAKKYADLKIRLAESHGNHREKYTDAKADFVNEIVKKAMA